MEQEWVWNKNGTSMGTRMPFLFHSCSIFFCSEYRVTHPDIAAFDHIYTFANDGAVSGLLLLGSPSNERRQSHGSIDCDVAKLCGVVMDFFGVNMLCVRCVMA